MLHPSNDEILNEGMHIRASLTTCRHSEMKDEVVAGNEPRNLCFPIDFLGEKCTCMACCIFQIRAGARVNDGVRMRQLRQRPKEKEG